MNKRRLISSRSAPVALPRTARRPTVELYASGEYSLKTLTVKAFEIGLHHWRGDRRMTKSEIHRMLQYPIYTGDFWWLGERRRGSHERLVSRETFDRVQAILHRKSGSDPRSGGTPSWARSPVRNVVAR